MPLVPFRAKNTPERFPAATVALAALCVAAYLLTANFNRSVYDFNAPFLTLRPGAANALAASWDAIGHQPWRLITYLFLHDDPIHLVGNLLMLGVFAPAVEGRLGAARFAALFLAAGAVSGAFQALAAGVIAPAQFVVGASGAIMGLAGAYLYCFPFAAISVAATFMWRFDFANPNPLAWVRPVCFDVAAKWVVAAFFVFDLAAALWTGGAGGVANFAHVAGLLTGLGTVALLKTPRDTRRTSDARKLQAEGANLSALSAAELSALLVREPQNETFITAYGSRLLDDTTPDTDTRLADALARYGAVLAETLPAERMATALIAAMNTGAAAQSPPIPPAPVFRVGAHLEKAATPDALRVSAQLYRTLFKQEKTTPDAAMALLKYAQATERLVRENLSENATEPILMYQTLLRRFAASPQAFAAREGLARLGAPEPDGFGA